MIVKPLCEKLFENRIHPFSKHGLINGLLIRKGAEEPLHNEEMWGTLQEIKLNITKHETPGTFCPEVLRTQHQGSVIASIQKAEPEARTEETD